MVEPFFISTSKAENLRWQKDDVIWRIETVTGKSIEGLSTKPHQREVLIPPDREFVVVKKTRRADGKWYIHLREEAR